MQRYYPTLRAERRLQRPLRAAFGFRFMSVDDVIATPEGKRRYVRSLFATIADRYDLLTVVLSCGQDRRWKKRLVDLASVGAEARAVDLATGTGDIAFALAARGASVVGLDGTP